MADFAVQPGELDRFAKALSGPGALDTKYLVDNGRYVDAHTWLTQADEGWLFKQFVTESNRVHDRLISENSTISAVLVESSDGLTASAAEYHRKDAASAAKLDQTYKPEGVAEPAPESGAATPPGDPCAALTEPSAEGPVAELSQQIIDAAGLLSVSDIVFRIIKLCGNLVGVDLDVFGWLRDKLAGDFSKFAKVKGAIENLGKFDAIAAADVGKGADDLFHTWTGNAADAAKGYFGELREGLAGRVEALEATAKKYDAVLLGLQELAAALEGAITALIDAALEAAGVLAAAGCVQEIPVVDVLVDLLGAEKAMAVAWKAKDVIDIWGQAVTVSEGGTSVLSLAAGLLNDLSGYDVNSKLPKAGYHNDSQGPAPEHRPAPAPSRGNRPQ